MQIVRDNTFSNVPDAKLNFLGRDGVRKNQTVDKMCNSCFNRKGIFPPFGSSSQPYAYLVGVSIVT